MAKILVIEDNPMVAEMISDFLGIDGHQVTVSAELPEIMRLVAADKPDLILADNSLDGYDVAGWEIVRIIREQEGMQSIPVVGMSGFSSQPDRESARDVGMRRVFAQADCSQGLERNGKAVDVARRWRVCVR